MRFDIHHHHHTHISIDNGLAEILNQLLADNQFIKGKLTHMDEQIDQLNATAEEELAAEQDLAASVHEALDIITAEANQLATISEQLAELQAQSANGTLVPKSKLDALQAKMNTSVANIKTQTANLKNAIPGPPPQPPVENPPAPDNPPATDSPTTNNPPADNPPA